MNTTSRTLTKSEVELFRILERANLLQYFSAFVAQGGDDVSQLHDAVEEEFNEILTMVGMSCKPLHIRRLKKALDEWKKNPEQFQQPLPLGTTLPAFTRPIPGQGRAKAAQNANPATAVMGQAQIANYQSNQFATRPTYATHVTAGTTNSVGQPGQTFMLNLPAFGTGMPSGPPTMVPISAPGGTPFLPTHDFSMVTATPSLPPVGAIPSTTTSKKGGKVAEGIPVSLLANATLTPKQREQIEIAAEELIKALPDYPVKEPNLRLLVHRSIQSVVNLPRDHPDRIKEVFKYSAIYGRFNGLRRTGKPMSLHEVSVNEASAQLAIRMPALLTRREDLFPLARQVVKMADGTVSKPSAKSRKKRALRTQQLAAAASSTTSLPGAINGQRIPIVPMFDNSNYNSSGAVAIRKLFPDELPQDRDQALNELNLVQSKMNSVKFEMTSLIGEHEQLRNAFRNAKQANLGTLMAQIQKQIEAIAANQQIKVEEQAIMVVRQRRLMEIINKRSDQNNQDPNPVSSQQQQQSINQQQQQQQQTSGILHPNKLEPTTCVSTVTTSGSNYNPNQQQQQHQVTHQQQTHQQVQQTHQQSQVQQQQQQQQQTINQQQQQQQTINQQQQQQILQQQLNVANTTALYGVSCFKMDTMFPQCDPYGFSHVAPVVSQIQTLPPVIPPSSTARE